MRNDRVLVSGGVVERDIYFERQRQQSFSRESQIWLESAKTSRLLYCLNLLHKGYATFLNSNDIKI